MRCVMTTVRDLRNWLDTATTNWDGRDDAMLDALTETIRERDHPPWGTDWADFLAALPELTEFV